MPLHCNASCLAAALLALAACAEKQQAATPQPSQAAAAAPAAAVQVDACQLLTKQEIEAALGKSVGEPVPETTPPVFGCRWAAPGFDGVSVAVLVFGSPTEALGAFEMALKINNYDQIAGVGERAYTSPIYEITVLKSRYELSVDVTLSQADRLAIAKQLAEKALARLP